MEIHEMTKQIKELKQGKITKNNLFEYMRTHNPADPLPPELEKYVLTILDNELAIWTKFVEMTNENK
jgi:hypothetical protein